MTAHQKGKCQGLYGGREKKNTNNRLILRKVISSIYVVISYEPGASEFSCDNFIGAPCLRVTSEGSPQHQPLTGWGRASAFNSISVSLKSQVPDGLLPDWDPVCILNYYLLR